MPRHEYVATLLDRAHVALSTTDLTLRTPNADDREGLAVVMDDAYRGTIDYDGEGLGEARAEIDRFLKDDPLLECSGVAVAGDVIVSACLVGLREPRPLISYVMTAAQHKNQGLASHLLARSLDLLATAGHAEVSAWITEGNLPSEVIFRRAGFKRYAAE